MRRLVTGKQMKEIDAYAIQTVGIPSMVLMERAALSVADELELEYKKTGKKPFEKAVTLIFCGTGNNGADGAAIARILHLRGFQVSVITVGDRERWTEEMRSQIEIDEKLGIAVESFGGYLPGRFDVAVDAIFGVGLTRDVEGEFKEAVEFLTGLTPEFTVAVDIPSGISSETGRVMGTAVKADLTVTFGYEKVGTAIYPGKGYSGRVAVKDIGFPDFDSYEGKRYFTYEPGDQSRIPGRKKDSHKGTYGKVLIAAGSKGMCRAAYLSALSAYRTGAGLVKILTVDGNVPMLQTLLPEAIITSYPEEMEAEEPEAFRDLVERECAWASVIVLGPGLGRGRHVVKLTEYVLLSAYVPIILDADGLNTVAEYPHLAEFFTENVIVTPHLGEMARLVEKDIAELREDLPGAAVGYCEEKGVTCVLKDAVSVVAGKDGSVYINSSGGGAMAKAGSGDVLTGLIAGLIALGLQEDEAAAMGVWLHGLAGERAAAGRGEHSILAREIADSIMQEDGNGRTIQQNLCGN